MFTVNMYIILSSEIILRIEILQDVTDNNQDTSEMPTESFIRVKESFFKRSASVLPICDAVLKQKPEIKHTWINELKLHQTEHRR